MKPKELVQNQHHPLDTSGLLEDQRDPFDILELKNAVHARFPTDRGRLESFFTKVIRDQRRPHLPGYLRFLHQCVIEAAACGFESLAQGFGETALLGTAEATGRDFLDIRNLLALRIYLADVLVQSRALKMQTVQTFLTDRDRRGKERLPIPPPEIQKMQLISILCRALFIGKGLAYSPPIKLSTDHSTVQFSPLFEREESDYWYYADEGHHDALVAIGQLLGRPQGADRAHTFAAIGRMSLDQIRILFPDILDSSQTPTGLQIQRVVTVFCMPYEMVRDLFRAEEW